MWQSGVHRLPTEGVGNTSMPFSQFPLYTSACKTDSNTDIENILFEGKPTEQLVIM